MPRRTKEDALVTRQNLLDAAERIFHAKGVSATSLADIAAEAGATRGAIYWHFKDKADLFNAMMERVVLPLEDAFRDAVGGDDPLSSLRRCLFEALARPTQDERFRRVFEVAIHKVEFVDSLGPVRERRLRARGDFLAGVEHALRLAAETQNLHLPMSAKHAAWGLLAVFDGLLQNWLLEPAAFDLPRTGQQAIDVYLAGLGFTGLAPED